MAHKAGYPFDEQYCTYAAQDKEGGGNECLRKMGQEVWS